MPQEFAMAARTNPDDIGSMAETLAETQALQSEALVRQYVLIVDRSGSMATPDRNQTRWQSAGDAVSRLVQTIFQYDVDHSLPLYLFDHETTYVGELTDPLQVLNVFREFAPRGSTALARVLSQAMSAHAGKSRVNFDVVPGTTFIVILDGATDDDQAVREVLQHFADPRNGHIDNHTQIAVSFLQVGDDENATRFLQDLDENLKPLDIVDHKLDDILYEHNGIERLLHDAIFD
jgi:hypothetical protein